MQVQVKFVALSKLAKKMFGKQRATSDTRNQLSARNAVLTLDENGNSRYVLCLKSKLDVFTVN